MKSADEATCTAWLENPEDLGTAQTGDPASICQIDECRQTRLSRGATFQCDWAPTDFMKPTGILTNSTPLLNDSRFFTGWQTFTESPGSHWRVYSGPLPTAHGRVCCRHGGHPPLRGKDANKDWMTTPTAAYPPELCRAMAAALLQSEVNIDLGNGTAARTPTLRGGLRRRQVREKEMLEPMLFTPPS